MNQHMVTALCSMHIVTLIVLFLLINLLPTVDTDASTLLTTKLAHWIQSWISHIDILLHAR
jgi:hypothetical protein